MIAILIVVTSFAQNGINYKAIAKDGNGNIVANDLIQVNFSILQGTAQTNVYEESHSQSTDANGVIILNIGEGTVVSGDFTTIDWASDEHYLNVQINTGNGLVDMGTTQFKTVPYALSAGNVTGLEALDEGNEIGWRLKGRNPNNYGNIGGNAIDFSSSFNESNSFGATGFYSSSFGLRTTASGLCSIAMGQDASATATYSLAFGAGTVASGGSSIAMGNNTIASGNFSTAMGFGTEASGQGSFAMGMYNIINSNMLLAVGNGTSDSERSNIFTVFKSGQTNLNSNVDGLIIQAGNGSFDDGVRVISAGGEGVSIGSTGGDGIFISQSLRNGVRVNSASFNGIYVNSANNNGGFFIGDTSGVHAESSNDVNPDIILGGTTSSTGAGDDGIIASDPIYAGSDIFLRSNDAVVVQLDFDNNETGQFEIKAGNGNNVFEIDETGFTIVGNSTSGSKLIVDGAADAVLTNNGSGIFQIGSSSGANILMDKNEIMARNNGSASTLYLNDDGGNVLVGGSIVQTSDKRLKKDITNLSYGLNEILQLQPKAYNWKNREQDYKSLGLIAQEVQPIIKEIVNTSDDEMKTLGISYTELIPVLVNAIKEQQSIIKDLKKEHQTDMSAMLERIEKLEAINNQ